MLGARPRRRRRDESGFWSELLAAFERCDAVLCPTTATPAFRLGENTDDPLKMYLNDVYTVNCNLAGLPGVSLPGGWAGAGDAKLPVGVQLLGPAFAEQRLLQISRLLEDRLGVSPMRPPLAV